MAIEIAQNLDAVNMIRAQQNVVGRSIIGGAGAVGGGNLIGQGEQTDILTSIKIISEKTLRAIKVQNDFLEKILNFDKQKDRREREQAAEEAKERNKVVKNKNTGPRSFKDQAIENDDGGFLAGIGLGALGARLSGIFKGIKDFVDKIRKSKLVTGLTRLGAAFGKFGPIGMIILGLSALVRYGEDLVKTLTPVLDGLKRTVEILQPITDVFLSIADTIIKTGLREIGTAFEAAFIMLNNSLQFVIDIVKDLADLIYNIIFFDLGGIVDSLKGIGKTFSDMNTKIANVIIDALHGLIDSLPLLTDGMRDKLKSFVGEKVETPKKVDEKDLEDEEDEKETVSTTDTKGETYFDQISKNTESQSSGQSGGGFLDQLADPVQEEVKPVEKVIKPEKKPKVINMDQTSSATKVAEKVVGNPNIPPLGLNMYQTTGDTWRERADQWNEFKKALEKAEKDGTISGKELEFRVMQLKAEKDNLQNTKKILDVKKQRAEITGETVDEAGFLKERDVEGKAQQERILAEEGMTVASFDKDLNQKLKPNVNKRDLQGDTQTASTGTVITDAKQTVVTSSNINKQETYTGAINTSSGDGYFDRQSGSYAT